MQHRSLRKSEKYLLWIIGITSVSAFVMTITIIVLIMQGNKRSFYHERVSSMQSGIITFMAEVVENRDDNTGGHIRRTAEYVESIAKELKRHEAFCPSEPSVLHRMSIFPFTESCLPVSILMRDASVIITLRRRNEC